MAFTHLGATGRIGNLEIKNRTVMTAMGVGVGDPSGNATDEFIRFYTERAKGGAGLIVTEVVRVNEKHGRCEYDQLALSSDDTIPSFRKLADSVHQYGTKIFAQLHHPGRESHLALHDGLDALVSSSPIPSMIAPEPTRALETEEVEALVKDFAAGAVRAQKAGMDGVEIHAGHGYLITQFLSANDNYRTDKYGGSLENRQRFLMEIIAAVREACGPDYPISVRMSSSEFLEPIGIRKGITVEESALTAKACEDAGVNFINVSAGTHFTGSTIIEPTSFEQGWKIPFAAEIKKHVSIPVAATGVIREPEFADKIIADGMVDFVAMGRSWLADPEWGVKALAGRCDDIRKCTGCMYCFETAGETLITGGSHAFCAVNPYMGQETLYGEPARDGAHRKAVVVGGGPGGMEAALILAQREFDVTLFEKGDRLGGQMYLASQPPHRGKMGYFAQYCEKQFKDLGVDVRLNTEATAEAIRALNPCAVILASGSAPILPRSIPGVDGENVCTPVEILGHKVNITGKRVVVAGAGLTGMETAEYLAVAGNEVTIFDMLDACGAGAFQPLVMNDTGMLAQMGVRAMPGHKLVEIRKDAVVIEDHAGFLIELPCDVVVMSLGVRSVNSLKDELADLPNVLVVGEADKAGQRVPQAVHSAFHAAYDLKV
ncbi:MAG: FAD-dependent oxidoreductase [Oscillospiraceae bacterium]|nr:FAD-dependent oxidoreductase [Oscillospiraceae bacterium]